MMKSMLPDLNDKKVLMLGCGTGEESEFLDQFHPQSLTGVDISPKSIAIAQQNYPNCNFLVGDALNLPFDDAQFDFIYSSLVITHIENLLSLIKEIRRILRDDGMFLFSAGHPLRFSTEPIKHDDKTYHVIGFEKSEGHILGSYLSRKAQINHFSGNEILKEYIAPPSYYFQVLKNNGFQILDFKESQCIDACKEVDATYYHRFHELPQFLAFLAQKSPLAKQKPTRKATS